MAEVVPIFADRVLNRLPGECMLPVHRKGNHHMDREMLWNCLSHAVEFRKSFLAEPHDGAFRLVNGFTEHLPGLVIDIFAKTAVLHDYSADGEYEREPEPLKTFLLENLPWLKAVVLKKRSSDSIAEKNGVLIHGVKPDTRIREHGIAYAIDLQMNRDNSFYADTRFLRKWLIENMAGRSVLNTFAYTGSLGVAALGGHASEVIQTDLSEKFLALAGRSCSMNAFHYTGKNFIAGNLFPVVGRLKKMGRLFDCVILDPPFFSKTEKGTVDLEYNPFSLINKVRPLVNDGGTLVVVNNSLFLSGREFLSGIDGLCDDIYLKREMILPVPEDFIGFDPDYLHAYAVSPDPFIHPTKIVILKVARK